MEAIKIVCDTNTISSYVRQDKYFFPEVYETINKIGLQNIYITPVVYIELQRWLSIYKGLTPTERKKIKLFLDSLPVLHLNKSISALSMEISKKHNQLEPSDILIGATAVYHNLPVYTLNKKHFKQIENIKLY